MSRIQSKNTQPELRLRRMLRARHMRYRVHVSRLPGKPDIVFSREKIAVFVDGDYWHGWRFPSWGHKLSSYWRHKIASNRKRDEVNRRALRRSGWMVIRLWEHDIEHAPEDCVNLIEDALRERGTNGRRRDRRTRLEVK